MTTGPILLTGAGGDIGVALARALREAWPHARLIGADCDPDAVGAWFVDQFHVLPRADAPDYVERLRMLIEDEHVQALVPLAEAELARLLSEQLISGRLGNAALVTANRKALAVGLDKLATARTLAQAGIAVPQTGIIGEDEPGDYDLIIKPRRGQGSKGLRAVSRCKFDAMRASRRGDLWQCWLKDECEEYTCGIARFGAMETRSLSFRRTLQGGLTGKGEVVHDDRLTSICERVAELLELDGAINIQLRIDAGEPTIFEINPRFSSTVGFRHRLGFTDAVWAIEDRLGYPAGGYEPPAAGSRIERVAMEVVRPPAQ